MNKLFDLRFVIGLFFAVIGILLLIYTVLAGEKKENINIVGGLLFTVFGLVMIFLSNKKEEPDHTH